jgi:hypothetical protein
MLKQAAPPMPGMTDTLEFVKNLWSGMNVPGVGMPGMAGATLSTDALDKKIADLKAVEAWLEMNTSMLRTTIQALEVQRGTVGALKSMSATMAQAMSQASEQAAAAASLNPFMSGAPAPAAASGAPGKPAADGKNGAKPNGGKPAAQAEAQAGAQGGAKADGGASAQPGAQSGGQEGAHGGGAGGAGTADMQSGMPGLPAAMAWWNLLQDQFTQAVTGAMAAGAAAAAKPAAPPGEAPKDGEAKG